MTIKRVINYLPFKIKGFIQAESRHLSIRVSILKILTVLYLWYLIFLLDWVISMLHVNITGSIPLHLKLDSTNYLLTLLFFVLFSYFIYTILVIIHPPQYERALRPSSSQDHPMVELMKYIFVISILSPLIIALILYYIIPELIKLYSDNFQIIFLAFIIGVSIIINEFINLVFIDICTPYSPLVYLKM